MELSTNYYCTSAEVPVGVAETNLVVCSSDPPLQVQHHLLPAVRLAAWRLLLRHAHLHAAPLQRHQAQKAHPV